MAGDGEHLMVDLTNPMLDDEEPDICTIFSSTVDKMLERYPHLHKKAVLSIVKKMVHNGFQLDINTHTPQMLFDTVEQYFMYLINLNE